jgi:hypothetical protein
MDNQGLRPDLSGRSLGTFEQELMAGQRRECFANFRTFLNIMHMRIQGVFDFNDQMSCLFVMLSGSEVPNGATSAISRDCSVRFLAQLGMTK